MADLTKVTPSRDGETLNGESAAGGGDAFVNTGSTYIIVHNGDASPMDVTFVTQSTVDGQAVADRTETVAAGDSDIFGPFQKHVYNDGDDKVQVTYSSVTSLTVDVLEL